MPKKTNAQQIRDNIKALLTAPPEALEISDNYKEIALRWLQSGDLEKAVKECSNEDENILIKADKLLRDKGFLLFVNHLKEKVSLRVFIDKNVFTEKLQKEFLSSSGVTTAKLSQPLLKVLDLDHSKKTVKIELPDEIKQSYKKQSFNPDDVESVEYEELIKDPDKLLERNEREIQRIQAEYSRQNDGN